MAEKLIEAIKVGMMEIAKWIVVGIANNSYWICVFCAFAFILMYVMGHKKYAKYVPVMYVFYIVMQVLKSVFV